MVCVVLVGAAGAAGAVDWASSVLRSPSPAPLSALTAKRYVRPPVSPVTVAVVALWWRWAV